MEARDIYSELTVVPRVAVSLPLAVEPPPEFRADDPTTWPTGPGRFEYVDERLWYMPPCGVEQQQTVADLVGVLAVWRQSQPAFVVGTNEAGIYIDGEVRAADAAVWRRADLGPTSTGFPRVAPVLAVEVAGRDDTVLLLRDKAKWYLEHGVAVVWLVDPASYCVHVIDPQRETVHRIDDRIDERPELPGLAVPVAALFRQLRGE